MEFLKKQIEKVKPYFEEGGKLEKYYPAFDALETFLFTPEQTNNEGTHVRDSIDLKRTMFLVILALIPALLFGIWNEGHQHFLAMGEEATFLEKIGKGSILVLPIVIVSYAVGLGIEFAFCIAKQEQVNEGFLVSGMLIPLIMPVDVPLWMVAVGTAFAVIIGKEVFGGTGMNVLNVALTARAFLFFAYPTDMSGNKVWVNTNSGPLTSSTAPIDGHSGETLLAQAANATPGLLDQTKELDGQTKQSEVFVNQAGDVIGKSSEQAGEAVANMNATFMDAVIGTIPGSVGETSVIAIAIGAFVLLWTGIGSWRIMLSCLFGGIFMAGIFNWVYSLADVSPFLGVPIYMQLAMGGFAFGLVFMATDPVTAAQTNKGKWIYGFLIGLLAILIRTVNPAYPEGVFLAILFMNVMAPLIDHYVVEASTKKRMNRAEKLSSSVQDKTSDEKEPVNA